MFRECLEKILIIDKSDSKTDKSLITGLTIWQSIIVATNTFHEREPSTLLKQWKFHKLLNFGYAAYLISKLILDMIYLSLGIRIWLNLNYILHVGFKMLIDSSQAIAGPRFDY